MRTNRSLLALLTLGLALPTLARAKGPGPASAGDLALYARVAGAVKSALAKADMVEEMRKSYRALRLIDEQGKIAVPALAGKGLLAPAEGAAFVDKVVACAARNPYLNAVLRAIGTKRFSFARKPDAQQVVRGAVGYAMVLDRLTRLARGDWHLLEALKKHWAKKRRGWMKVVNAFEIAKILSIDKAVKVYLDEFRAGKAGWSGGRTGLPLNILEAAVEDLRLGHTDNARAGFALAVNPPGCEKKLNRKTGAGPSGLTADGNGIVYLPPLPRQWMDLYSTWNMGFVSHYPNFPYFLSKLLTPQVLCYQAAPGEYLYNRVIALYAHIHYEIFTRLDRKAHKPGSEQIQWADKALTRLWAKVNRRSASAYQAALVKAEPTLLRRAGKLLTTTWTTLAKNAKRLTRNIPAFLKKHVLAPLEAARRGLKKGVVAAVKKGARKVAEKVSTARKRVKKGARAFFKKRKRR